MQGSRGNGPTLKLGTPDSNGTVLIEVEGGLDDDASPQWGNLLRDAVDDETAMGLAIDLRGCPEMSAACLVPVMEAAGALERGSQSGVALVVLAGSPLERQLALTSDVNGTAMYGTVAEALSALGGGTLS